MPNPYLPWVESMVCREECHRTKQLSVPSWRARLLIILQYGIQEFKRNRVHGVWSSLEPQNGRHPKVWIHGKGRGGKWQGGWGAKAGCVWVAKIAIEGKEKNKLEQQPLGSDGVWVVLSRTSVTDFSQWIEESRGHWRRPSQLSRKAARVGWSCRFGDRWKQK